MINRRFLVCLPIPLLQIRQWAHCYSVELDHVIGVMQAARPPDTRAAEFGANFPDDWRPSSSIPMQTPMQEDVECLLAIRQGLTRNRQLHNFNRELKLDSV